MTRCFFSKTAKLNEHLSLNKIFLFQTEGSHIHEKLRICSYSMLQYLMVGLILALVWPFASEEKVFVTPFSLQQREEEAEVVPWHWFSKRKLFFLFFFVIKIASNILPNLISIPIKGKYFYLTYYKPNWPLQPIY